MKHHTIYWNFAYETSNQGEGGLKNSNNCLTWIINSPLTPYEYMLLLWLVRHEHFSGNFVFGKEGIGNDIAMWFPIQPIPERLYNRTFYFYFFLSSRSNWNIACFWASQLLSVSFLCQITNFAIVYTYSYHVLSTNEDTKPLGCRENFKLEKILDLWNWNPSLSASSCWIAVRLQYGYLGSWKKIISLKQALSVGNSVRDVQYQTAQARMSLRCTNDKSCPNIGTKYPRTWPMMLTLTPIKVPKWVVSTL